MAKSVPTPTSEAVSEVRELPVKRIRAFKGQPRRHFDPKALQELADSMAEVGQLHAIIVKRITGDPDHDFELADGERRWRARMLKKLPTIRAEIRVFKTDQEQFEFSMVSNFGREGMEPMDAARAIDRMMRNPTYADLPTTRRYELIGRICGQHSHTWAAYMHGLLKLHPEVRAMLEPDAEKPIKLSLGQYLAANVTDQKLQLQIAKIAQNRKLTVTKARLLARELAVKSGDTSRLRQMRPSDDRRVMERMLQGIGNDCERVLSMSSQTFRRMFLGRPEAERLDMLTSLDRVMTQLTELRQVIARAKSGDAATPAGGRAQA